MTHFQEYLFSLQAILTFLNLLNQTFIHRILKRPFNQYERGAVTLTTH